jgi:hypothetical protein
VELQTVLFGALIAFLAAATQSVTGFGFAMVSAPLLAVVWGVKPAVASTVEQGERDNAGRRRDQWGAGWAVTLETELFRRLVVGLLVCVSC